MTEPTWTLTELLAAQVMVMADIDDATCTIGSHENLHRVGTEPAYREAKRRLPELRKVETLLMERIKEALAPTEGGEDGKPL